MNKLNKLFSLLLVLVLLVVPTVEVSAAFTYSSQDQCVADANASYTRISGSTFTTQTVRQCIMNFCNNNTSYAEYYVTGGANGPSKKGTCANGNIDPKKTISRSNNRTGACRGTDKIYYYIDATYDCNYTSSGAPYSPTTTTTTTTTTRKPTTAPTTKKPTTKKPVTEAPTQAPTTEATTASTSTEKTTSSTTVKVTSDASIKKIVINKSLDLKYTSSKSEYGIKVPYSLDKFDVAVTPNDKTAKVDVAGTSDISSDGGVITITVTSSDGTNQTVVTIDVTRYTREEGDCTASMIFVQDYDLDFSSNTQQYTVTLANNEKTLDIEVTPNQEGANYAINGNEKLRNGSKIQILINAVDGTQCSYQITVKKKNNLWIYLILIVVIGVALFFTVKKLIEYLTAGHGRYKYE